jgi:hypothetical protein
MKKSFALIISAMILVFFCSNCTKKVTSPSTNDSGSKLMKKVNMYDNNWTLQEYLVFSYNNSGYITDQSTYSVTISASPVLLSEDIYTYTANNLTLTSQYAYAGVIEYSESYSYDGLGRLISETYNDGSGYSSTDTYEYNAANMVSKDTYSSGGTVSSYTVYNYNASNLTTTADQFDSTDALTGRTKYYYDGSNKLTMMEDYSESGTETLIYYTTYTYSGGLLADESEYWENSGTPQLEYSYDYTYYASGLMATEVENSYSGGVISYTYTSAWEYNSTGAYTKYTWCDNGVCTSEVIDYDSSGRITKVTGYDASNAVVDYYLVEY